jgi:L-amino acid N-acyltransferase YncA
MSSLEIHKAIETDFKKIWKIFHNVIQGMDTYSIDPDISENDAKKMWMATETHTYIASINNEIVGTYIIRPNQPGLGSHVANAAYMVDPNKHGLGIGKAMCLHSLKEAKKLGYLSMQFNFVVSTNTNAVELWKKMGFKIIGTSPQSFNFKKQKLVDTYIMHRFLDEN